MLKKMVLIALVGTLLLITTAFSKEPKIREFEIKYSFTITDIPTSTKEVSFWVPVPETTEYQTISEVKLDSSIDFSLNRDDLYGNKMAHATINPNGETKIPVTMTFKVKRAEILKDLTKADGKNVDMEKYLKANELVTISDRIKGISADVTKNKTTTMDKAQSIYNYVFDKMEYDKSGEGWGRGDTEYACDVAKGNCTDFHSLFISLARAANIPARFKIGFPVSTKDDSGKIGGYHCWAEFFDDKRGWVPVDASEAKKAPEKKDYFFGSVCENRVELTTGRDLTLAPPQKREKLNFFVYPYIEVDGETHTAFAKAFSYKNN
ncbi:transglutaminase-like domain-containing protein [Thermodesulfobacteriota bacterium]